MRTRSYKNFASKKRRFLNFLLDTVIMYVLVFGLCCGLILFEQLVLGSASIFLWIDEMSDIAGNMYGSIFFFFYYVFFESIWGRTPAKFITRTRVVDANGKTPGWLDIMGRTLTRIIPFEAFSFLTGHNLHDRFSRTEVVID